MAATYEDVEQVIRAVPGVADASVRAAEGTTRGRLRIRLVPGHDPDVVARAVSAALAERFGIHVDPSEIRPRAAEEAVVPAGHGTTAVVDEPAEPSPARGGPPPRDAPSEPDAPGRDRPRSSLPGVEELFRSTARGRNGRRHHRPVIRDLEVDSAGLEVVAEVLLELGGRELRGRASAAATPRATYRAIARATLDAIETLFPGTVKTEVERIDVPGDAENACVTVTVTLLTDDGSPETHVGASIVRTDPEQAVMRATLDALNRRLDLFLEAGS